jgi:hypothetical protein
MWRRGEADARGDEERRRHVETRRGGGMWRRGEAEACGDEERRRHVETSMWSRGEEEARGDEERKRKWIEERKAQRSDQPDNTRRKTRSPTQKSLSVLILVSLLHAT